MIILTSRNIRFNLSKYDNIELCQVNSKTIYNYNCNDDVYGIICSRNIARIVDGMELANLKFVHLTSAGFDNVPIDNFREKGIDVCNAGSVYSIPMAEMVIYGLLKMQKRYYFNPNITMIRPFRNYHYIKEIYNKTALILATGNIGTEIAKRLSAFGVRILGYDKYVKNNTAFEKIINERSDLIKELATCDFVISTLPATEETKKFIDFELLSACKKDSIFVNVGRRQTIDEDALYLALKKKCINGAVLDMFEYMPNPVTNRFRRLNNTIVFPGVTAISQELNDRLDEHIGNNIIRFLNNEELMCVVNKRK